MQTSVVPYPDRNTNDCKQGCTVLDGGLAAFGSLPLVTPILMHRRAANRAGDPRRASTNQVAALAVGARFPSPRIDWQGGA